MKLAARLTTLKYLAIGPLAALLFAACQSLFNPPRPELRLPTQAEVIRAAQDDYVYGAKRLPRDTAIGGLSVAFVHDDSVPILTIETMTRKRSVRVDPLLRLIARINSSGDYRHLGIRRGDNFVWRDISGTNWITPNETQARSYRLVGRDSLFRPAKMPHEPGLLRVEGNSTAIVACLDCPDSGHCLRY